MKNKIISLLLPVSCFAALASNDYPKIQLDNGEIQVSVYLPDAERGYYRGTRFDWSGIIERVNYRGHRFYAPLHKVHDPHQHDAISGPADEFAMFQPMGYAEAKVGGSFVKIGVGMLAKNDAKEYLFHRDYPLLRAGDWQVEQGLDWVSFDQNFRAERGWAYRYRKTIRLLADRPEMIIAYQLENTGEKLIDINQYNHNFTLIDGTPYGPDYSIEFPFVTEQPQRINNLAWFRDNGIEVDRALGEQSLWIEAYRGQARRDYNAATVRNRRTGAAVAFSGDAPIERMVFWAVERAASPEPFIRIYLKPGESQAWSTHYRYSAAAN